MFTFLLHSKKHISHRIHHENQVTPNYKLSPSIFVQTFIIRYCQPQIKPNWTNPALAQSPISHFKSFATKATPNRGYDRRRIKNKSACTIRQLFATAQKPNWEKSLNLGKYDCVFTHDDIVLGGWQNQGSLGVRQSWRSRHIIRGLARLSWALNVRASTAETPSRTKNSFRPWNYIPPRATVPSSHCVQLFYCPAPKFSYSQPSSIRFSRKSNLFPFSRQFARADQSRRRLRILKDMGIISRISFSFFNEILNFVSDSLNVWRENVTTFW